MDSLKFLNLSCALYTNCATNYNYTQPLNPDLLTRVHSIEILDLSHNGLTSWSDDRFIENSNLTHLYLQNNNLVRFLPLSSFFFGIRRSLFYIQHFVDLKSKSALLYTDSHNLLTSAFPQKNVRLIQFPILKD